MQEQFSIEFDGPAFEQHDISAAALAQSLLALDGLARSAAEVVYGKSSDIDIKVKGGFRPGSFIVDLLVLHEGLITALASAVTVLGGVFAVGKWAFGKPVREIKKESEEKLCIENIAGDKIFVTQSVVTVYNTSRTRDRLSRLTQTLDKEGANSITMIADKMDPIVISKKEREYFKQEEGLVLTDNEAESILEVVGPKLNGSPKEWTFSEGEDGLEFTANVEDEEFLASVRDRKIVLENGTSIRAVVRTIQRKKIRTRTERTVVEVKEVLLP